MIGPRDRRALLVGAGAVALVLTARLVPTALRDLAAARERLAASELLLQETRTAIRDLPTLEDSARVLTARVAALASRLLDASSESAALAELSRRLGTVLDRHQARLVRLDQLPDSLIAGALCEVRVALGFESDLRGVAGLLQTLAEGAVLLVPERITVSAENPFAAPPEPERLQVELRLTAWYLPRGRRA